MKKLLIANRGEIAIRIARAARDLGIATVAIHADADAANPHPALADESYGLGPGGAADTYLRIDKILAIARRAGADAVHPGYGFLAERPEFARAVIEAGLIWVGPPPDVIATLGDKVMARRIARKVGAPLVPGSERALASADEAVDFARVNGLPLAIKAVLGGGGRGMRVATRLDEVRDLFDAAAREAKAAFGDGACYVEGYLDRPRHVEVQIIADAHGHTLALGTRDCSLQRRHQKLIEEAPAPCLDAALRRRLITAASAICAEAGYVGAGTVEFLVSPRGEASFLEVNTRLQVEHAVSEEAFGIDIVTEQLRIADGQPLTMKETPTPTRHAIEFRINAEDAGRGFLPTPGRVTAFHPPAGPGVRVDAGVEAGATVPSMFDSLMAKLIVSGPTRKAAIARARRALAEFRIAGVASLIPFHQRMLDESAFADEEAFGIWTTWVEDRMPAFPPAPRVDPADDALLRSFVEIDGRRHAVALPRALLRHIGAGMTEPHDNGPDTTGDDESRPLRAPLSGHLQKWLVSDGDEVAAGTAVVVIEAMKSETRLPVERAGTIRIKAQAGTDIAAGDILATFD